DLGVIPLALLAELRHLPEDRHPAPCACTLDEIEEGRPHRYRVRVVGVVDDETAARKLLHLAAPPAEADRGGTVPRAVERETERVVGGERCEDVLGEMTLRERKLEPNLPRADRKHPRVAIALDRAALEAPYVEVVPEVGLEQRLVAGDDGDPAGRKGGDRLGVGARDVGHGADELEMLRADGRDEGERGPGDVAERCDLP